MAITTVNGFVTSGTTLDALITDSNSSTWYKIYDADAGAVYTDGASSASGGWVSAADLASMTLPETDSGDLNNLFFQGWDSTNGSSDWAGAAVTVGDVASSVDLVDTMLTAGSSATYDQVIDATDLSSKAWLRVYNADDGTYLNDGWIRGADLDDYSFTVADDGASDKIWVDTYLHNSGRSGWEDVKVTGKAGASQSFTLTTGVDSFDGGSDNDTFTAPTKAEGGIINETMQSFDDLDGGVSKAAKSGPR